jgi:hypothetical protein
MYLNYIILYLVDCVKSDLSIVNLIFVENLGSKIHNLSGVDVNAHLVFCSSMSHMSIILRRGEAHRHCVYICHTLYPYILQGLRM